MTSSPINNAESRNTTARSQAENPMPAAPIQFYGGYQVYSETGIDLTLLKERLKLTVTERWERNCQALKTVEAFREAGRARRVRSAGTVSQEPS
jgi:hypothetical protein